MDMKRLFLTISFLMSAILLLHAQSNNHNYIKVTTTSNFSGGNRIKVIYYDDMGREEQTVIVGGSPTGGSIVSAKDYDEYGREKRLWLQGAVSSNSTGSFTDRTTLENYISSSNDNDAKPYSLTQYELSPLNRPTEQYGPGAAWQANSTHSVRTEYLLNISGNSVLNCKKYTATITASSSGIATTINNNGDWSSGALTVTKITDEDGLPTYTFYDRNGEVILSRQFTSSGNSSVNYDTYYIRDEWGNLQAVLPPMAADQTKTDNSSYTGTHAAIANYAYLYCYDSHYRQIGKKLPGCAWIYTVYDKSDYPILTQDGNQRASNEWSIVIPDAWGRPCINGTITSTFYNPTSTINNCVIATRNGTSSYSYNGLSFTFKKRMTDTYYDDYTFIGSNGFTSALVYFTDNDYGQRETTRPVGLPTGVKSMLLNDATTPSYIYKAIYYDYHKKPIQTRATNHLNGTETEWVLYDLLGRMTKSKHTHTATGHTTHTQCDVYTYDNWDRLLTHTHQMDGASAITLASNTYDGIGRLVTNSRNGTTTLSTSRSYNVRSWLKTLTNNKFSETLYYNTTRSGSSMPACWNGNISSMEWTLNSNEYSYDFRYDKLHRLTDAKYDDEFGDEEAFMTNYGYDKNGNIDGIMRQALNIDNEPTPLDEMWLYYTGNQLQSITNYADPDDFDDYTPYPVFGSNNAYAYDQNGNTTKDLDRNISSIQYNLLNLPQSITYTDGSMATYTYNSLGEKLQVAYSTSRLTASLPATNVAEKVLSDSTVSGGLRSGMTNMTMNYFGNLVYNGNNLSRVVLGNDGLCRLVNGTPTYYFFIKDHLGSTRAVVQQNGVLRQANQYYPYGKCWDSSTFQPYLYNGKEIDLMHDLEWYDYGARMYEPGLCRFMTMDPLCEKYYNISPYAYCVNNPVNNIDLDGRDWIYATYDDEQFVYFDERIFSQEDIEKYYNNSKTIMYLGVTGTIYQGTENGSKLCYSLKSNGLYTDAEGNILQNEVSISNKLHVGSSVVQENVQSKKNMYGIYLGSNNPKTEERDIYAIPPIDMLDYAAFRHDKGYDSKSMAGMPGVFLNSSNYGDDWNLAVRAFNEILTSNIVSSKWRWALGTSILFGPLATTKRIIELFK